MPLIKSIEDIRDKIVENVKGEAASFIKGVPSSEIVTIGKEISTGSILKRSFKMEVPFVKGKAVADQIVHVDIPVQNVKIGTVYFINPFERKVPLPHEFGAIIEGRIPSSWILERSWGFGTHASAVGEEDSLLKLLLADKQYDKLYEKIEWNHDFRGGTIKLPWGLHCVPTEQDKILLLMRTSTKGILKWNYMTDVFYHLIERIIENVERLNYRDDIVDGDPIVASEGLARLVQKLEVGSESSESIPEEEKHRFCSKCGSQIELSMKFCPKCGAKLK
jgi:hypothetical protein